MMLFCLALTAAADSFDDPYDALQLRLARSLAVDQLQGRSDSRLGDVIRWQGRLQAPPDWAPPRLAEDLRWLDSRWTVEQHALGREGWQPTATFRPELWTSGGDLAPLFFGGDEEPGLFSMRAAADASVYSGPLVARARVRADLDLAPSSLGATLEQFRLGARTDGFELALAQEDRRTGPARRYGLIFTDNAHPVPALELHGEGRLPGGFDPLGRFSGDVQLGALPGARTDVQWPLWLIMDARWLPLPYLELGLTRNALFGGQEDGQARPIDWGQLLLPTEPHIYGDTERQLYDSDERIGIDLRGTLPIRRLSREAGAEIPIDYLELYIQHGAEDTASESFTLKLAGAANVYGVELGAGPLVLTVESAIVEDDYQRWYVGHRLYHEGWSRGGYLLGHGWGGDSRALFVQGGVVALGPWTALLSYERAHKWLVADLVQDTLFVFPGDQTHHIGRLRAAWMYERGGALGLDLAAGSASSVNYLVGQDELRWRAMLRWTIGDLPRGSRLDQGPTSTGS